MNWIKALGFGILIWVIMFVIVSALIAAGIYKSDSPGIVSWIVAVIGGVIVYILAGYLRIHSVKTALTYGITFVVISLILDFLITAKFNPDILTHASLWFSYALGLLAPLLRIKKTASL